MGFRKRGRDCFLFLFLFLFLFCFVQPVIIRRILITLNRTPGNQPVRYRRSNTLFQQLLFLLFPCIPRLSTPLTSLSHSFCFVSILSTPFHHSIDLDSKRATAHQPIPNPATRKHPVHNRVFEIILSPLARTLTLAFT